MGLKGSCCKKFKQKAKACSRCPIVAPLDDAARRALLKRARQKLRKKRKKKAA